MENYKKHYEGKTVLVTGGAGAVGGNLVRELIKLKAGSIIILDNLSSSYRWNIPSDPSVLFVEGDVTNDIDLKRVFNEDPDIIFHLAAFFANQNSVDYPEKDLRVNGFGILKMLEYSRLASVDRFVYSSSGCAIYGSDAPMPLKEDSVTLHLSTPYQATKMLGELYCNFFHHYYDLPVVKIRFFNSFGPGEVPGEYRNVIPNFIYWAIQGRSLPITGTGEETRDFTYVGDIVDGLLRGGFFEKAVGRSFNLGSGVETKVIDLAHKINELTDNKAEIGFKERRKWDTKDRLLASIKKARNLIDYESQTSFDDGLEGTVEWFKDNWSNIERSAEFGPGASSAVRGFEAKKDKN